LGFIPVIAAFTDRRKNMLATIIKRKGYSYIRVALSEGIKELAML
jgi:hypothetical protein